MNGGRPADPMEQLASLHAAMLYSSPAELTRAAVPFLAGAADSGSRAVAVTTPPTAALLRAALPPGVKAEFVDADAWYATPGQAMRRFDEYLSQHEVTGTPLSVFAEPVWAEHDRVRRRAWHRSEALWALSAPSRQVRLLCAHDLGRLDPGIVATARRTHPCITAGEVWTTNADYQDPRDLCDELAAEDLPMPGGTLSMIEFDVGDLAAVRSFVARNAVLARLVPGRVDDIVTAVNEVALNAVVHGGGHGCLRCWRDPWQLVFEVEDDGRNQPDQLIAHVRPRRESLLESGFGLWIANQLSDVLEVRGGPGWLVRLYTFVRSPQAGIGGGTRPF